MNPTPTTAAEYVAKNQIPIPQVKTASSRSPRPLLVGPDMPDSPFPIPLTGPVQKGFGRGGKDLGCPTGVYPFFTHQSRP